MHSIIQVAYSHNKIYNQTMNKLPANWKKLKIEDCADIIGGGTPSTKKKEYWDGNISWITPKDLSNYNSRYISRGSRNISEKGLKYSSARLLPKNSVLLTTRAPIGYLAISKKELATNQGFKSLIMKNGNVPEFFYYLLKNNIAKLLQYASGTTFMELNATNLKSIEFYIPEVAEQKRIASILSSFDDKIELNNKTNKILEEMAQTIFEEWFINFNFPTANGKPYKKSGGEMIGSELGEIPKGWKIITIGDYAKLKSGFAFKNSWWQNDGIPVIKIQNISSGNLNFEQCSFVSEDKYNIAESFRVNGGDLLISLTGSLGKFAIVPKLDKDALVNQRVGKFFLGEEPVKKLPFLYGILNELRDLIVSLANGSVQQNISPTDIENVKIIFPSDKMLNKYNNLMQDVFYKIIFNQRENEKLSKIRDSLLPKLMAGEIRAKK